MRHRNKKTTLGREKAQREALLRNLAQSLIVHGAIETTLAKAKALRPFVEPLITKAKVNSVAVRRELLKTLYTKKAVKQLIEVVGPKYKERKGGYTRIIKAGHRPNDGAPIARIELV